MNIRGAGVPCVISGLLPGPTGPAGAGGAIGYYGSFYDKTDQPLVSTTAAQVVSIGMTSINNGVSIAGGNRVLFDYDGVYSITFSIQWTNTGNSVEQANVWLKLNGNDIADTNTRFDVHPKKNASIPGHTVGTVNFVLDLNATDYIQVYWSGTSTDLKIEHFTNGSSPVLPETPGIIVTATQVMYTQVGPTGPTGATGPTGPGVASGGAAGQILEKASSTNYDTKWSDKVSIVSIPLGWRSNTWTGLTAIPTVRAGMGASHYSGKVYLISGITTSNVVDGTVYEYDIVSNTYATKASVGTARNWAGAATLNDKIYYVGGATTFVPSSGGTSVTVSNVTEEYDPVANTWTTKASLGTARWGCGVSTDGTYLYATGGATALDTASAVHEQYNVATNTWSAKASLGTATGNPGTVGYAGVIYACAGWTTNRSTTTTNHQSYDPTANTWTSKTAVTGTTGWRSLVEINGLLYHSASASFLYRYSISLNTWSTISTSIVNSSVYVSNESNIYAFGSSQTALSSSAFRFNLSPSGLTFSTNKLCAPANSGMTIVNDTTGASSTAGAISLKAGEVLVATVITGDIAVI